MNKRKKKNTERMRNSELGAREREITWKKDRLVAKTTKLSLAYRLFADTGGWSEMTRWESCRR